MCPPRLPTVIFQLTLKPPKVYYIANSGFVAFKSVKSGTWGVLSRVDSTKIVTPGELMTLPLIPSRLRRGYPFPILHTIASSASQSRRLGSSLPHQTFAMPPKADIPMTELLRAVLSMALLLQCTKLYHGCKIIFMLAKRRSTILFLAAFVRPCVYAVCALTRKTTHEKLTNMVEIRVMVPNVTEICSLLEVPSNVYCPVVVRFWRNLALDCEIDNTRS